MTIIANSTTLVAGTGTGPSYQDYKLVGDNAIFREVAPVGQPGFLSYTRTEPKPTKDYAGVGRSQIKLTRNYVDALGVSRPAIVQISTSLPETMTQALRDTFVIEATLAFQHAVSQACLKVRTVPQS